MQAKELSKRLFDFQNFRIKTRQLNEFSSFFLNRAVPAGGFIISIGGLEGRLWCLWHLRLESSRAEFVPRNIKAVLGDSQLKEIPEGFEGFPVMWLENQSH